MRKTVYLRAATGNPDEKIILIIKREDPRLLMGKTNGELRLEDAVWLLEFIKHLPNDTVIKLMRMLHTEYPEISRTTYGS